MVLDASAVVEVLLGTTAGHRVGVRMARASSLHAPGLIDLEVIQAIRRYCAAGVMPQSRGDEAIRDLADLPLRRYPHAPMLRRIWDLRHNVTAYDAAYIVLAEVLSAPLLTRDTALASIKGIRATIEVL